MRSGLFFILMAAPTITFGCLWDRDTISIEAHGRIEVVETVLGWFDRYPPLYYEMRLKRVSTESLESPDKLDLYDDAAVACDRLGRPEEAIEWMKRKEACMAAMPPESLGEHRYRHLSNLGTFLVHQWLINPNRLSALEALDHSIQCITEALKINPNAHFGRERTQLQLLHWLREQAGVRASPKEQALPLPGSVNQFTRQKSNPTQSDIKGLCGIIQMGAAQDSLDIHALLAWNLVADPERQDIHATLSHVTNLRVAEMLVREKRVPLFDQLALHQIMEELPAEMKQGHEDLRITAIAQRLRHKVSIWQPTKSMVPVDAWFLTARKASIERRKAKDDFMLGRLSAGLHPDTHPDFWDGWKEPVMPALPMQTRWEKVFGPAVATWLDPDTNRTAGWLYLVISLTSLYVMVRRRFSTRSRLPA